MEASLEERYTRSLRRIVMMTRRGGFKVNKKYTHTHRRPPDRPRLRTDDRSIEKQPRHTTDQHSSVALILRFTIHAPPQKIMRCKWSIDNNKPDRQPDDRPLRDTQYIHRKSGGAQENSRCGCRRRRNWSATRLAESGIVSSNRRDTRQS